jgi:hypothetical protein
MQRSQQLTSRYTVPRHRRRFRARAWLLFLAISVAAYYFAFGRMSAEQKIDAFLSGDDARQAAMARILANDLDASALQQLVGRCHVVAACGPKLDLIVTELWRSEVKRVGNDALRRIRCTAAIPTASATARLGSVIEESVEPLERQTALTLLQDRSLSDVIDAYKVSVERHTPNKGLSAAIAARGPVALQQLAGDLGSNAWVTDPLARMGRASVGVLTQKLRARESGVRFAAADALVLMGEYQPDALVELTSALDSRDLRVIARQYAFYIRLGRIGSEGVLLQALSRYFSVDMCVDYLNCGNSDLGEGARRIARERGYDVTSGFGSHGGPHWGEAR